MQEVDAPLQQQSYAMWILKSLGAQNALLLALAALTAFLLTLVVILRGRGPAAGAALGFILPLPLWVGMYAALSGTLSSLSVIATANVQVKASDWAEGIAMTLVAPLVGMLLMVPSYLLAMIGLVARSLLAKPGPPGANEV